MMDCDTTGIEPDLALVKFKKLVGGGSMQIVNQTVPRALRSLGYQEEQVEAIVEYIAEHGHVVDAPGLRARALRGLRLRDGRAVDRADGSRADDGGGAAVPLRRDLQDGEHAGVRRPSRTSRRSTSRAGSSGLKALAIYRDNCKVGQPLSASSKSHGETSADASADAGAGGRSSTGRSASGCRRSARRQTVSFTVGGAEGYLTAGVLPGRRPRRGLRQARQAGLDAGRRDGRVLDRDLGRPAVRRPAGDLRREVHQHALRAGRHDRRPGHPDRDLGDGLPLPPARAGLPAVRDAAPSWASSPPRSAPPRSARRTGRASDTPSIEELRTVEHPVEHGADAAAGAGDRGTAPRPSCWSGARQGRPTRRSASPAARRCARPAAATSARAAAPPRGCSLTGPAHRGGATATGCPAPVVAVVDFPA